MNNLISFNINRVLLDSTEEGNSQSISIFLEEVISSFETNHSIKCIKISFMYNDNYIFILEDKEVTKNSIPYILEDMFVICRIRRIKVSNVRRMFIKVSLQVK